MKFAVVIKSLLILAGASAVAMAGAPEKAGSAPGTYGAYRAIFRGDFTGEGKVIVTPFSVTITGDITDHKKGTKGVFITTTLLGTVNGRFSGAGLAGTTPVSIYGRIEPSGGKIKAQRVLCTLTSGSKVARIVATK